MKKVIVILMVMTFISLKVNSQCSVTISADTTITCGSAQLNVSANLCLTELNSGTSAGLTSVYFIDADTGYAVGSGGTIIKTTDAGNTWGTLNSGTTDTTDALMSVYFTDANTGYAVGSGGTIIKTTDAGNTWKTLNNGTLNNLTSVYFTDANTGYAVGGNGTIIQTTNAGNTWGTLNSGTTDALMSVYFTDANTGYAVGYAASYPWNGIIIKTTDAGNTWEALNSGTSKGLYSVYFPNANTGYAVGDGGGIIQTTNAGNTWNVLNCGTSNVLCSVYFTDTNTGYAVGYDFNGNGLVIQTTDAGNTWNALNSGTSNGLYSVYFTDANTGYAVGNGGTIIKYQQPQNVTYKWSPATGLSATDIPNPIASPIVTTTYKVTVTSNLGTVIDSVKITITPLPAEEICYVEFDTTTSKNSINWSTNLSGKIDSVYIYEESSGEWIRIGSASARTSSFIDKNSNPFNQSYSYKISVKDTCGFETDTSAYHTTVTLLKALNSGEYDFSWSAYKGLMVSNYYLYGITTSNADSLIGTVSPPNPLMYNYSNPYVGFVKYFVGFYTAPCSEKSNYLVRSNYVDKATGINENAGIDNLVSIYPNPANDIVTIDFQGYKAGSWKLEDRSWKIELYSIIGELIRTLPIQSALTQVNISDLAKGVYIIKIINDNGVAVKRVVKE